MDPLSRVRKTVNHYQDDMLTLDDVEGNLAYEIVDVIKPEPMKGMAEAHRVPAQYGNTWRVMLSWRGKLFMMRLFFPFTTRPTRKQVQYALDKIYPLSDLANDNLAFCSTIKTVMPTSLSASILSIICC